MRERSMAFVADTIGLMALAAVMVTGCEWPDINALSPTAVAVNNNNNGGCATCGPGGIGTPTPTPAGGAACATATVTCTRVERPAGSGKASAFTIAHACGLAAEVTAVRASDGLRQVFTPVVTGDELDPGPSGAGGGQWTVTVTGGGSCSVPLDT